VFVTIINLHSFFGEKALSTFVRRMLLSIDSHLRTWFTTFLDRWIPAWAVLVRFTIFYSKLCRSNGSELSF
jgi:hypothetical protein